MNNPYREEFENTHDLRAKITSDLDITETARPARLASENLQRTLAEVERRDATTAAHTWRVTLYTRTLVEAAGMDHSLIERISEGAALHDIGKLDVPVEILQKPGRLTPEEFRLMQEHPVFGHARLVADGVEDMVIINLVRHHHERVDGLGYPDGLAGNDIPVGARYFSVVDVFDALTSVRPYRREVGPEAAERAIEILKSDVGTHYHEEAVFHLVEQYRKGNLSWIMGYFNTDGVNPAGVINPADDIHTAAEKLEWARNRRRGA